MRDSPGNKSRQYSYHLSRSQTSNNTQKGTTQYTSVLQQGGITSVRTHICIYVQKIKKVETGCMEVTDMYQSVLYSQCPLFKVIYWTFLVMEIYSTLTFVSISYSFQRIVFLYKEINFYLAAIGHDLLCC